MAAALIYYFFMPVFAGEIILEPYLQAGGFRLHYYGLILGAAIMSAYFVSAANSWRFGIAKDEVDKFAFWLVLVSFIFARIAFVLVEIEKYENPVDALRVQDGGLSIFGAIIGAVLFTYFYARKKAFTYWQLLDVIALGLPLAQAIGRFGNFVNYEIYGQVTNLPWKMYVPETGQFHHPAFLYESIFNVCLFAVLYKYRGKLKPGVLALIYLASYSSARFLLEQIRVDVFEVAGWQINELVSPILFLTAAILLFYRLRNKS